MHALAANPAAARTACSHCAKDVPRALVEEGQDLQFCCAGCRTAYAVIHSCGLEAYYKLLATTGDRAPTADGAARTYAEFDDPTFAEHHTRARPDGLREVEFALDGVHCGACLWLIEKLPRVLAGVTEARLHIRAALVTIVYDPAAIRVSRVAQALSTLGYTPHPAKERSIRDLRAREDRRHLVRIAVAGACAGNVMMLAFALYGGYFDGMGVGYQWLFRGLSAALGLFCLAGPGGMFFRSAFVALRTRTPNIDVPIVLALLAGGAAGLVNTVLARGELYFDSLTMLVLLLLFGRYVGHKHQRWAADAVELLYSVTPFSARRVAPDGAVHDVPAEALVVGDVVEVRAGESLPVDGEIVLGRSSIDISLLSGESRPVPVGVTSTVHAGAVNLAAPIRVRASATGRETRAGRLMQMVGDAAARRAGIIRFTDSIAGRFIAVVLVAALATFAYWWPRSHAAAVDNAIALLIVTCPCVLGIAAPIAVGLTIGRASKDRVLIKGGDALETLARPGTIVLDKTGTLTEGKPRVVRIVGDAAALPRAAAVEQGVSHPLAHAIRDAALAQGPTQARPDARPEDLPAALHVQHQLGKGVAGQVDGARVFVGSEAAAREHARRSAVPHDAFDALRREGLSAVAVVVDGALTAVLGIGDRLRDDAGPAIDRLRQLGWDLEILSGDHPDAVRRVGASLGLPVVACHGGVSPEEKLAFIQARRKNGGTVVMVGDGVNDAAALAASSVGIAVHGGAEASLAAADVSIVRPGLAPIVQLVDAGPRMLTTIHRMLVVSAAYNLFAGVLAATGTIHPMIAAALMPLSSLSVLTVAIRSKVWKAPSFSPSQRAGAVGGPETRRITPPVSGLNAPSTPEAAPCP